MLRKYADKLRREAGDTLIEVTMALSILSIVLTSSTVVAADAFRMGQTAKERTSVAADAQSQMEAVRAFRDANTWDHFLNGDPNPGAVNNNGNGNGNGNGGVGNDNGNGNYEHDHHGRSTKAYKGILNAAISRDCVVTAPCMHMDPAPGTTYLPQDGRIPGSVPTSYVEMVATPQSGATPNWVDITVNYGFEGLGGRKEAGHISTRLTNLNLAVATPTPPAPLPCVGRVADIVLVIDVSVSMGAQYGNGTRLDAAKATASNFIDKVKVSPAGNHVAVEEFSTTAKTDIGLTGDPNAAKAALQNMTPTYSTDYVPALNMAGQILAGGRPGAAKDIVFLSDGNAKDAGNDLATTTQMVQNAIAKLPAGVTMYTIGIRQDEDTTLLYQIMPINGGTFGDATSPERLQQIYTDIAGQIACSG